MILDFDDYPIHQTGSGLDEAATSDVRFFDRYWFSVMDPQHRFGLIAGLGVYKNMDVLDGFVSVARAGRQTNLRVSRRLRPDWLPFGAGPYRMEIIEPMKRHRLTLQPNEHGIACDLTLEATGPAFKEAQYITRDRGWLEKDYQRLFQSARATGWVQIDGERFDSGAEGWPAARDRSFGVRPGVGGPGPARGKGLQSGVGSHEALVIGSMFETTAHYGTWAVSEDAEGTKVFVNGAIYDRAGRRREVRALRHDLNFAPGSLAFAGGFFKLTDEDGREWRIEVRPTKQFIYQGFGYMNGWSDKQGLGAFRGDAAMESERYDLRDPTNMIDESGLHLFGKHGLIHSHYALTLDGEIGHGEGIAVLLSQHRRYGEG